jgi:hypothetical protein
MRRMESDMVDATEAAARPTSLVTDVRIISGRRITLPEQVCDEYNLREGSHINLVRQPNGWLLTPAAVSHVTMRMPDGGEFTAVVPP